MGEIGKIKRAVFWAIMQSEYPQLFDTSDEAIAEVVDAGPELMQPVTAEDWEISFEHSTGISIVD